MYQSASAPSVSSPDGQPTTYASQFKETVQEAGTKALQKGGELYSQATDAITHAVENNDLKETADSTLESGKDAVKSMYGH